MKGIGLEMRVGLHEFRNERVKESKEVVVERAVHVQFQFRAGGSDAVSIARLAMLRCLKESPGRAQILLHTYSDSWVLGCDNESTACELADVFARRAPGGGFRGRAQARRVRAADCPRLDFPYQAAASNTSRIMRNASTAAGAPQYTLACSRISETSSRVTPLVSAARICVFSSCGRFSAVSMAIVIMLRSRGFSPVAPTPRPTRTR